MRPTTRQKGIEMPNIEKHDALKLSWDVVAGYMGSIISALLGRTIRCQAKSEDGDYWSISAIDDTFLNTEIVRLAEAVQASEAALGKSLPTDSNTSKSLDMELCQVLLKAVLHLDWVQEYPHEDALWIMGKLGNTSKLTTNPACIYIEGRPVDTSRLLSADAFMEELFFHGGYYDTLCELCEDNEADYGHLLYWHYPISDGEHNGCYFFLVKEGVLILPYDEIECEHNEVFLQKSAKLCTSEELAFFIDDWVRFQNDMTEKLGSLQFFLQRLEGEV